MQTNEEKDNVFLIKEPRNENPATSSERSRH